MAGKIESGSLGTVAPTNEDVLKVGDLVLCTAGGAQCLHLIKAKQGGRGSERNLGSMHEQWAQSSMLRIGLFSARLISIVSQKYEHQPHSTMRTPCPDVVARGCRSS